MTTYNHKIRKTKLMPLSYSELRNLSIGQSVLAYRQATDEVYDMKIIVILSEPSPTIITKKDSFCIKFNVKNGLSSNKEWVACKPIRKQNL